MRDVLVLGSGPAGYYAALLCAKRGLDVILVEEKELGGTGFYNGALPIKILLDEIKQNSHIPYDKLIKNYKRKRQKLHKKLKSDLERAKVKIVFGKGEFIEKDIVKVKDKTFKAKKIIIATGSRPKIPFSKKGANILTHEEALFMEELPEKMTVLGADVEGIEFATLFSKLGVKVTLIDMAKEALPNYDKDLKKPVINMLKSHDVDFLIGEKVVDIYEIPQGVLIKMQSGRKVITQKCLTCTSRIPNIPKGTKDIGVICNDTGIVVDEKFSTSLPWIYAIGDVNGICLMGSAAINQGIQVGSGKISIQNTYEGLPRAVFSIPEIAGVGMQEWELRQKGIEYKRYKGNFCNTWRGISRGYSEGFAKILVDDGILKGIWMVGKDVSELVGPLDMLIKQKTNVDVLKNSLLVHPSLSEIFIDILL